MEGEKKPSALSDVGAWGMNVISSVGIIMANKQLMSPNGYAFSFDALIWAKNPCQPDTTRVRDTYGIWPKKFGYDCFGSPKKKKRRK